MPSTRIAAALALAALPIVLLTAANARAADDGAAVSALSEGREVPIAAFPWTGKRVDRVYVSLPVALSVEGIFVLPCVRTAPVPAGMKLLGRGFASFGEAVDVFPIEAPFEAIPEGWRASLPADVSFEVQSFDLVLPAAADLCIEAIRAGTPVKPLAPAATDSRAKNRQTIRKTFKDAGAEGLLDRALADKDRQWRLSLFDDGTFAVWGRTPEKEIEGGSRWKDHRGEGTFELLPAVKGKREIRLSGTLRSFDRSTRQGADSVTRTPAGEKKFKDVLSIGAAGVAMRGKKPALGFSKLSVPAPAP